MANSPEFSLEMPANLSKAKIDSFFDSAQTQHLDHWRTQFDKNGALPTVPIDNYRIRISFGNIPEEIEVLRKILPASEFDVYSLVIKNSLSVASRSRSDFQINPPGFIGPIKSTENLSGDAAGFVIAVRDGGGVLRKLFRRPERVVQSEIDLTKLIIFKSSDNEGINKVWFTGNKGPFGLRKPGYNRIMAVGLAHITNPFVETVFHELGSGLQFTIPINTNLQRVPEILYYGPSQNMDFSVLRFGPYQLGGSSSPDVTIHTKQFPQNHTTFLLINLMPPTGNYDKRITNADSDDVIQYVNTVQEIEKWRK